LSDPLSSIRTVTVGFGVAPNLLTPAEAGRSRASGKSGRLLPDFACHRRWGISPRPENEPVRSCISVGNAHIRTGRKALEQNDIKEKPGQKPRLVMRQ